MSSKSSEALSPQRCESSPKTNEPQKGDIKFSYQGSTFGLNLPHSSWKRISTVNERPHLETNPLNPWYLSNGIPDFAPRPDKNYELLKMKRKMEDFDNETSNEKKEDKIITQTTTERAPKKMRSADEKTVLKSDSNKASSDPTVERENVTSLAQSLLKSIRSEKEKTNELEKKIMSTFDMRKT